LALSASEHPYNGEIRDADGRLIIVGKDGASLLSGEIEVKNDTGSPVPVSGTVTVNTITGYATETTLGNLPDETGTWGYYAGASGTVNVTGRVLGIAAHATTTGTVTINAGSAIPIPANTGLSLAPRAQLTNPSITFTGTDSYIVEVLS
jgi:hypothetical protein